MCRYSFLPSCGRRRGSNAGAPTPVRRWEGRSRDLTRKAPARYHAPVPINVLSLHELVDIVEQIFTIAATCDLRDVMSDMRDPFWVCERSLHATRAYCPSSACRVGTDQFAAGCGKLGLVSRVGRGRYRDYRQVVFLLVCVVWA